MKKSLNEVILTATATLIGFMVAYRIAAEKKDHELSTVLRGSGK